MFANDTHLGDESWLTKRNQGLIRRDPAFLELQAISVAANLPFSTQDNSYVFDGTGGAGATVYIIDTGADLTNDVSSIPSSIYLLILVRQDFLASPNRAFQQPLRWIYPQVGNNVGPGVQTDAGAHPSINAGQTFWTGKGHGTAMLSKVCGHNCGVAKAASSIVVKCTEEVSPECYLRALDDIRLDITNPANGFDLSDPKVVVLFSVYWPTEAINFFMNTNAANIVGALQLLYHIVI